MFRLFAEHHDIDKTDFFFQTHRLAYIADSSPDPRLATGVPLGVYRSSGFRVRLPTRMTLLNPATVDSLSGFSGTPWHQFTFETDRQKLDDVVFQSVGPFELTDRPAP